MSSGEPFPEGSPLPLADSPPGYGATGGYWRSALLLVPIFIGLLLFAGLIAFAAVCSRSFRQRGFLPWVRAWGRVPLWLLGIRLDVHGLEHRDAPGPKLLLFNHVSELDILILSALCPERPIVLYKKEFGRIPGLGWALSAMGMISVDRSNHEAAIRSVGQAGERVLAEKAAVMMAPEGTRSRKGGLQKFKLGAFHLATSSGVPIVPLVLRGIDSVLPMGKRFARSGVIRVDFLEPVATSDWETEDLRENAEAVREVFLRYVPAERAPLGERSG
jgi:putative phosphoserine phosphatase / 1-acylglycerol-3-phosphate O-acyltransferase